MGFRKENSLNRLSLNDITDDAIGAVAQQVTGEHARCGDHTGCHQQTCTVCGKVFVSARPQALYCSPRCKRAVLLRRRHEAKAIVWLQTDAAQDAHVGPGAASVAAGEEGANG